MKYWMRSFKAPPDIVAAETQEDAEEMDSSESCDNMDVDDVTEIDPAQFIKRGHPSWRDYYVAGDPECRTLAEIAGLPDTSAAESGNGS